VYTISALYSPSHTLSPHSSPSHWYHQWITFLYQPYFLQRVLPQLVDWLFFLHYWVRTKSFLLAMCALCLLSHTQALEYLPSIIFLIKFPQWQGLNPGYYAY
jgi:hypothetical protein